MNIGFLFGVSDREKNPILHKLGQDRITQPPIGSLFGFKILGSFPLKKVASLAMNIDTIYS